MKRLVAMAVLPAICAGQLGCCACGPKTGWSFQVGRPASVSAEMLVGPQVTTYGASGIATMPAFGAALGVPLSAAAALAPTPPALGPIPRPAAVADPCATMTQDELCRRLLSLESAVRAARPAAVSPVPKPMPRGED